MMETPKMKKVRITILKTTFDSELAKEFGMIGLGPCPLMKAGEVYYADYAKPEGFCDEAWKAIYQYVFALAHGTGENLFYYGDWIRKPGVAIVSCNAGLRPVHKAKSNLSCTGFLSISVRAIMTNSIAGLAYLKIGICNPICT